MIVLCYPGVIGNYRNLISNSEDKSVINDNIVVYDYESYCEKDIAYISPCYKHYRIHESGLDKYCNNMIKLSNESNAIILASAHENVRNWFFTNRLEYNHTKGIFCIFPSLNLKVDWMTLLSYNFKIMLKYSVKFMERRESPILVPNSFQNELDYIQKQFEIYKDNYYHYDMNIEKIFDECYPHNGYYKDAYCIDDIHYDIIEILKIFKKEEMRMNKNV